jgi:hypothetical protein
VSCKTGLRTESKAISVLGSQSKMLAPLAELGKKSCKGDGFSLRAMREGSKEAAFLLDGAN